MQRALELAYLGRGRCSPNPMVGCVIVHNDEIIGEGWHRKAGEPHAEVNAINSVKNKELLKDSTLYVTLEPCSFHGRTPPCCELVVKMGVKKVVIACPDPNPKVAGDGVNYLKSNGTEVVEGILLESALTLNRRFFKFHSHQQPFITLKWAQSSDHYIDPRMNHNSKGQIAVSGPVAKILSHKIRAEEDAVLVGTKTLQIDTPSLNVRNWKGRNPVRLFIDRELKTRISESHDSETWVLNSKEQKVENGIRYIKLIFKDLVEEICHLLYSEGVMSLMVEGGSYTLQMFIDSDKWDEAIIYTSDKVFNGGVSAPVIKGGSRHSKSIGKDQLTIISK